MAKSRSIIYFIFGLALMLAFINVSDTEHSKNITPEKPTAFEKVLLQYDSLMLDKITISGNVGAAIAIIYKNKIVLLKCYGTKEVYGNEPINKNTVFRLGSVSKPISGVLAGILANEKIINFEDKVIDYLPEFRLKDSINTYNLQIRHILSHTSGLVPHAYDNLVEKHVPVNKILNKLYEVNISAPPGELYGYQNVIFSLFDTIATINTSKSFNDLLNEKIFEPFDMKNASTGYEAFKKNENKAYPHRKYKGEYKKLPLNNRYYNVAPAAGVNASISDMANFLIILLNNDTIVLKNNVREIVFSPQVKSPLKWHYTKHWDKIDSKHYAIGWRIFNYKGRKVAYHGGYVRGYRADIALCFDEEIGIAFLTNSPNRYVSASVPTFLNLFFEYKNHIH